MAASEGFGRPRRPEKDIQRKSAGKRRKRRKKQPQQLLLTCLLLSLAGSEQVQASQPTSGLGQLEYYAHLPKPLGLSAGLRVIRPQATGSQHVAAFLGLNYAAPPVGPLRLMPPGANRLPVNPTKLTAQFVLLPANQRTNQIREASKFGHQCVELSDWLSSDQTILDRTKQVQSEDCLNANLFIPLKSAEKQATKEQESQTRAVHGKPLSQSDHVMFHYSSNQDQQGK